MLKAAVYKTITRPVMPTVSICMFYLSFCRLSSNMLRHPSHRLFIRCADFRCYVWNVFPFCTCKVVPTIHFSLAKQIKKYEVAVDTEQYPVS